MKHFFPLLCLSACACLSSGTSEALLPPLYQGVQEIDAILHSEQLAAHLPKGDAEVIMEITRVDENTYLIKTANTSLRAVVTRRQKEGMVGPGIVAVQFKPKS